MGVQGIDVLVNNFVGEILKLDGSKIVTISFSDFSQAFDVDAGGFIGYDVSHKEIFISALKSAFMNGGGIIIRTFSSVRNENNIPVKLLYGVFVHKNGWIGFDEKQLKASCEVDAATGQKKQKEKLVKYKVFPSYTCSD